MSQPRAALYARVSTRDQRPENQVRDLRAFAERRGFRVVAELVEHESGAKADRARLAELMELARKREVDAVMVWKFDRFARSTKQLVDALEEFHTLGVDFVSYTESVDTTSPQGRLVFSIFSAIAEFERSLIRERIHAGLERARAEGTRLGRPTLHVELVKQIRQLRTDGTGVRAIARKLGVGHATVSRYTKKEVSNDSHSNRCRRRERR